MAMAKNMSEIQGSQTFPTPHFPTVTLTYPDSFYDIVLLQDTHILTFNYYDINLRLTYNY